ncbi:MAG: mono/diheme cytochrome c family protein, partial [Pirellulaceae bacterium]
MSRQQKNTTDREQIGLAVKRVLAAVLAAALAALFVVTPLAAQSPPSAALSPSAALETYRQHVAPLIAKYCVNCHGPKTQESDLRLDTLSSDLGDSANAEKWIEVMDNLNLAEMPPQDETQPPAEMVEKVTGWISDELRRIDRLSKSTGGRALLRRLSRTEYANAVRDLLGIEFLPTEGPRDLLPPDGTLDGFDKLSKALLLDASLMEKYFDVAAIVADKAVVVGPPPVPTRANRMQYEEIGGGIEYIKLSRTTEVTETGIVSMSSGMRTDDKIRHPWDNSLIPIRGKYRLRVRVGADKKDREALYIRITRGGDGDIYFGKVPGTIEAPQIIEIIRPFNTSGGSEIGIRFENGTSFARVNYHYSALQKSSQEAIANGDQKLAGRLRAQMGAQGFPNQSRPEPKTRTTDHLPRVLFDWIELAGPLYDQWPPKSTQLIFHRGLDAKQFTPLYAREIFSQILPRAFRRPVTVTEIDAITGVAISELERGESFTSAIKAGIIATLCSPSFLMLYEGSSDDSAPRPLNDYEMATRLSLLLWSSIPDEELYRLARENKLQTDQQLLAQVERMLADEKSNAIVDGFARQWLKADEFDRFAIDRSLYREFYSTENAGLNEAINAEPIEFFRYMLKNRGNALDFLDSNWTMANEALARHYGIEGVTGNEFVKVALPVATHRGGLTTMAALHKWGSDGNRTKPVERGKYILDVLFNDPPKPPPPNAGEVEPNVSGDNLTVRQRLDQHRTIPACANCHRIIDPYGFALENFNVTGTWRTKQDGERGWWPDEAVIDASATFPNGVKFETIEQFRSELRKQGDRFLRGLSEKMFS